MMFPGKQFSAFDEIIFEHQTISDESLVAQEFNKYLKRK